MLKMIDLYTLNRSILWCANYVSIKMFLKRVEHQWGKGTNMFMIWVQRKSTKNIWRNNDQKCSDFDVNYKPMMFKWPVGSILVQTNDV